MRVITMPKKDTGGDDRYMIPLDLAVYFLWGESQGQKIKKRRLEKQLSMADISKRLELEYEITCSLSYINKLEKGLAESVKTEKLLALIDVLDMDIGDFLT
jgi:DNA-binding Xre family transcriptional regulator